MVSIIFFGVFGNAVGDNGRRWRPKILASILVAALLPACHGRPTTAAATGEGDARARRAATGSSSTSTDALGLRTQLPGTREDTRFIQVRNLLSLDPESRERATKLYALVAPICSDAKERREFIEVAKWSASFSIGHDTLPKVLALDTIEHVATACYRTSPESAFDILDQAKKAIPDPYRFELITARLRAAGGELEPALAAAKAAARAGSIHAIALSANIEAQIARDQATGYRPGMLDDAIHAVSAEPTEQWSLIDLTAVLSTRAHLLTERAIWEAPKLALDTRREAERTYRRLAIAPFIETTRTQALDMLCFDSAEIGDDGFDACRRSAVSGNLGGAVLARVARDPAVLDLERLARLERLREEIARFERGSTIVVVMRGDESELITWARPAARVIALAAARGSRIVLLDRTKTRRAAALVTRMFELAGARPSERIAAPGDTLAVSCLAAILAGRRTPVACPLDKNLQNRIGRLDKFALAVLIGRDLDAEIDDFGLYELRSVLLSFRQPRIEKGLDVTLKSLSDVWIVSPRAEAPVP